MRYLKWTQREIEGLKGREGMVEILTEVDEEGRVLREIGLDEQGRVVHQAPSDSCPYGMFDGQVVDVPGCGNDIPPELFGSLWRAEPLS